jgi:AI-2 transport protein TqsA
MSDAASARGPSLRVLYGLAAVTLAGAGLRAAAPVLVPVALALFLAILCQPLLLGMLRRRVPVGVAVLITLLVIGVAIALFMVLLLGSLAEVREAGPHYWDGLRDRLSYTVDWWQEKGIRISEWVPARFKEPEALLNLAGGTLASAARLASGVTIVLLTLFFMLFEIALAPRRIATLPPPVRERLSAFADVSAELQRYLAIKTLMAAAVGAVAGLWVAALGVDFAVLCGVVAFAFHFVPNVGALFAAAPAMLIAFSEFDIVKALAVGAGYVVIGIVLGSLVEPALLGRRLNLSPLAVFLSLVFWGWLWGPIGMFLSVPMTMAIKIALAHSPDWAWAARLLDGVRAVRAAENREPPAAPAGADSR